MKPSRNKSFHVRREVDKEAEKKRVTLQHPDLFVELRHNDLYTAQRNRNNVDNRKSMSLDDIRMANCVDKIKKKRFGLLKSQSVQIKIDGSSLENKSAREKYLAELSKKFRKPVEMVESCNEYQQQHGDSTIRKPGFPTTANEAEDVSEVSLRPKDKAMERQSKTICGDSITERTAKVKPITLRGDFSIRDDGLPAKTHSGKIEITDSRIIFKRNNDKVKREVNIQSIEKTSDGAWTYWTYNPDNTGVLLKSTITKSRIPFHALMKLIKGRSQKNLLEKKGIIKNEDIFGNDLTALQKKFSREVPPFVDTIINYIEQEANIRTEHIYRISGNMATIQKIRLQIDKSKVSVLNDHANDVEVLTGTLKLFYRELVDPLIPYKDFDKLSKLLRKPENEDRNKDVYNIIENVATPHRENIKRVITHLLKVEMNNCYNKMTLKSLSIVWGPSMIWYQKDKCPNYNAFQFSVVVNEVVEMVLVTYQARTKKEQHEGISSKSKELRRVDEEKISRSISDEGGSKNRESSKFGSFFGIKRSESKDVLSGSTSSLASSNNSESKKASSENPFSGKPLESLPKKEGSLVPAVIVDLITQINKKPETKDLYIGAASRDYMSKFRKTSRKQDYSKMEPLDLAIILVKILKELSDPLLPASVFSNFDVNLERWSVSEQYDYVEESLSKLDDQRQAILSELMNHLCYVFQRKTSSDSRDNIRNVWLPVICGTTHITKQSRTFTKIIFDIYKRQFEDHTRIRDKSFEFTMTIPPNQETTSKAEAGPSEQKVQVTSKLSDAQLSDISNSIGRTPDENKLSSKGKPIGLRKT